MKRVRLPSFNLFGLNKSLQRTLLVTLLGVGVIPLFLLGLVLREQMAASTTNLIVTQFDTIARLKEQQVQIFLEERRQDVGQVLATSNDRENALFLLRRSPRVEGYRLAEGIIYELFRSVQSNVSDFDELFLIDRDGVVIVSTNPDRQNTVQSDEEFFIKGLRETYVSPLILDSQNGETYVYMAEPVPDFSVGINRGVLVVRLKTSVLNQIMLDRAGLGDSGETYLVAPGNQLLTPVSQDSSSLNLNSYGIQESLAGQQGSGQYLNYAGTEVIGYYRWLPEAGAALLVEQTRSEALATLDQLTRFALVALIFGIVVTSLVIWAITRRISQPIIQLTNVATRIASGDLDVAVEIDRRDEIGALGEAFDSMTHQLRDLLSTLEQRVAQRTWQLETVVGVSQRLSSILDLGNLIREVVTQIKENFNYYHVHIYMMDATHENLIMAEGYGEAGAEMKRQRHYIPLMSPRSLVARAAREHKIITVENVRVDSSWLPNPLLPDTHSEMAVPVILDAEVVGVLDVQSEKIGGLTTEDEGILQILANQLATTIRNVGLFSETQEALSEAEKLQRLYTGQGWEKLTAVKPKTIYEVRRPTLPPLEEIAVPEAETALQQKKTVNRLSYYGDTNGAENISDKVESTLATPLKLGNEIIGVLGIRDENPKRQWTDDEVALIEAVSEQMSLALENARLVEETQRNAWRDRMVSESTARVWSTPDIEAVMKAAVAQLGDKLRASEVVIRLGTKDELEQN